MTDLEVSKRLALAIGWKPEHVHTYSDGKVRCLRNVKQWGWQVFDYRDWATIGPIAERYDCFPKYNESRGWMSWVPEYKFSCAGTPQKAIALAVIQGAKK